VRRHAEWRAEGRLVVDKYANAGLAVVSLRADLPIERVLSRAVEIIDARLS
jgi:hypothetical protein